MQFQLEWDLRYSLRGLSRKSTPLTDGKSAKRQTREKYDKKYNSVALYCREEKVAARTRREAVTLKKLWARATIPNSVWTLSSPRKEKRRNARLPLI